jgi:F-type H+-transporting ATPase subunit epsilon
MPCAASCSGAPSARPGLLDGRGMAYKAGMPDAPLTVHVDVVSAHESIYSGEARFIVLPGEAGELGVYPRHTPFITRVKPGSVRIERPDGVEEFVFIAGGILEVQPDRVTVLSDTAIRGKDLDEEKAQEARRAAEQALKSATSKIDIARAQSELAVLAAQIVALRRYRQRK